MFHLFSFLINALCWAIVFAMVPSIVIGLISVGANTLAKGLQDKPSTATSPDKPKTAKAPVAPQTTRQEQQRKRTTTPSSIGAAMPTAIAQGSKQQQIKAKPKVVLSDMLRQQAGQTT